MERFVGKQRISYNSDTGDLQGGNCGRWGWMAAQLLSLKWHGLDWPVSESQPLLSRTVKWGGLCFQKTNLGKGWKAGSSGQIKGNDSWMKTRLKAVRYRRGNWLWILTESFWHAGIQWMFVAQITEKDNDHLGHREGQKQKLWETQKFKGRTSRTNSERNWKGTKKSNDFLCLEWDSPRYLDGLMACHLAPPPHPPVSFRPLHKCKHLSELFPDHTT